MSASIQSPNHYKTHHLTKDASDAIDEVCNTRIEEIRPLIPPACLIEELPGDEKISDFVVKAREQVSQVLHNESDRLLVVIGPCSIHDTEAAIEYAQLLKKQADKHKNDLLIVMRVYFEKPRTTVGWKGLINDPELNGSFAINKGLRAARKLLLDINALGLPVGSEMLDTISPQFISDLISWGAIGARTTESQLHRELVSGLSYPVGFKNGTSGNIKVAVDAIVAAQSPQCFISVTSQGLAAIVNTQGNKDCHLVLRGGESGPNYKQPYIQQAQQIMKQSKVHPSIMIDCSHGNSQKQYKQQLSVAKDICDMMVEEAVQLASEETKQSYSISGVMIESNLKEGQQTLKPGQTLKDLVYGQSITDACIGWEDTEQILEILAAAVRERRKMRLQAQ